MFYDNQVLLGIILQYASPLSYTLQKGLPITFSLAKKRIYLDTQLKGEITDLFWKLPACSTSRNRMMNTFIIVNITHTFKR